LKGFLGSKVLVVRGTELSVYSALEKTAKLWGLSLKSRNVVIKLNLCELRGPETGTTSDPAVVEEIVKFLIDHGSKVKLIESNSSATDADLAFRYLGFKQLEKKYDVACINLSTDDFITRAIDGYYLKNVKVSKTIDDADLFISHPKLKMHSTVILTGALKNQFGCLRGANKYIYHSKIHDVVADANIVFRPHFIIMDGIVAMVGYGPTNGIPHRFNMLAFSDDPVAIDCFGANFLGFNEKSIGYIVKAFKKGIGNMKYSAYGDYEKVDFSPCYSRFVFSSAKTLGSILSFGGK